MTASLERERFNKDTCMCIKLGLVAAFLGTSMFKRWNSFFLFYLDYCMSLALFTGGKSVLSGSNLRRSPKMASKIEQ